MLLQQKPVIEPLTALIVLPWHAGNFPSLTHIVIHPLCYARSTVPAAITAGYSPESLAGDRSSTVQAANGPDPGSQGSSEGTLLMDTGVKSQQLHSAQWNLDRLDQARLPLNQSFRWVCMSGQGRGQGRAGQGRAGARGLRRGQGSQLDMYICT